MRSLLFFILIAFPLLPAGSAQPSAVLEKPSLLIHSSGFNVHDQGFASISVYNQGQLPLEIFNVALSGPDADEFMRLESEELQGPVQPEDYLTFGIVFSPKRQSAGHHATLRFETNDPFQPEVTVALAVESRAVPHKQETGHD